MLYIPRTVTVLVDDREKQGLTFPSAITFHYPGSDPVSVAIKPKKQRLAAGDYALLGWEQVSRFEKKGSIAELSGNLTTGDRGRQLAAFDNLVASCKHPYVLLTFPVSELGTWHRTKHALDPDIVLDSLFYACMVKGLTLYWVSATRGSSTWPILGATVVRRLLFHAVQHSNQ